MRRRAVKDAAGLVESGMVDAVKVNRLMLLIARLVVGGVFVLAGSLKLLGSQRTGMTMFWAFFPPGSFSAYAMIGFELLLGLWLISGRQPRASTGVAIVTLVAFSIAIGMEMRKERPTACGCLVVEVKPGDDPAAVRRQLALGIARNVALIATAAWVLLMTPPRQEGPDPISSQGAIHP